MDYVTKSTEFQDRASISIEEISQARPPRGSGAPSRTRSHYVRILALLRDRGPDGVLSSELYDQPELYGRSPRNRISELRQAGHLIKTLPAGAAVVRYVLSHENSAPVAPRTQIRKPEPSETLFDLTRDAL